MNAATVSVLPGRRERLDRLWWTVARSPEFADWWAAELRERLQDPAGFVPGTGGAGTHAALAASLEWYASWLRTLQPKPPVNVRRPGPIQHGTARGYYAHQRQSIPIPVDDPCGCRAAYRNRNKTSNGREEDAG